MYNIPSKKRLSKLPSLYATEATPLKNKLVYLHLFLGGCDWYACEFDSEGGDIFFGFVILNQDYRNAEWGYYSLSELKSIKIGRFLEIDCELEEHWRVRPAKEIEKICKGSGWQHKSERKVHEVCSE